MTADASRHGPRRVGQWSVAAIGFGAMRLGIEGRPDERQAVRTVHAALDAGAQLIDTAINYCTHPAEYGYDEAIVARALREWSGDRDSVHIVCKGGNRRTATEPYVFDGRPENLRWSCETSLLALGAESIGLYMLHAVDPKVPLVESVGALEELRREGKIHAIGLSNVGRRQLAAAREEVDVVAVENRLSLWSRTSQPVADYCAQHEIAFLAWDPLGGAAVSETLGAPAAPLAAVAGARGVSVARVALAWLLAQAPTVIPIPGARRAETITDSLGALDLVLDERELESLAAVE